MGLGDFSEITSLTVMQTAQRARTCHAGEWEPALRSMAPRCALLLAPEPEHPEQRSHPELRYGTGAEPHSSDNRSIPSAPGRHCKPSCLCQHRTSERVPSMIGEAPCMAAMDAATSLPASCSSRMMVSLELSHQQATCCKSIARVAYPEADVIQGQWLFAFRMQPPTSNNKGYGGSGGGWSGRPAGQPQGLSS